MPSKCISCDKPLNSTQWRRDKQYKSCPKCSTENGNEHVYYEYPNAFGITEKRKSNKHPEGPQSHCVVCRGRGIPPNNQILCRQL